MNINNMLGNEPKMQERSQEEQIFAIEAEMKNLMEEYQVAARSGDQQRADAINNQIEKLQDIIIGMKSQAGDRQMELDRASMNMGGEASSQHMMPDGTPMPGSNHQEYEAMMMQQRQMMAGGGTPFPDLTGDGKITQADILKGRGVYAVGGEAIGDELEGMEMTEEQAMAELEESRGEFEQLQMLADVVKKLLNEGMGEAEIVAYLKEQGLDDEDIETLFSFLQEISGQESSMEQAPQGIDQQIAGMM